MSTRAVATKVEHAPEDVAEAIATGEVQRISGAVRARAERLRDAPDDEEEATFAEAIRPLLDHPHRKVRQAVAEAADVLPSAMFDAVLPLFLADAEHYVRAAIAATAKRRATRRKARARLGAEEKVLADILDQIEKKHRKEARRLAERAVRRGTEYFVAKLHHEVTKVVTPLESSIQRLRSGVAHPTLDRGALTHEVATAWERVELLLSVLKGAREATASVVPRFRDEALLTLVGEARAQLIERIGDRADRLVFTVDVAPSLRLDVHRSGLLQALQNFLQNAVEAYPHDAPRLEIQVAARLLRAGSQIEVTVSDRGVGMSERQREEAFVPFGSRKPGGTGVGLVIARSMIEDVHGGTLELEGARGMGTTVKVVLPARQMGIVHYE